MTCSDYLLTHVHLYNVLAKNMIPAINEKYATATVSLVRWSSDSATSEKLIKIKERISLPGRIRIYAGHLRHPNRRHRRRVPRWRATWIELRTAVNIVNSRTTSSAVFSCLLTVPCIQYSLQSLSVEQTTSSDAVCVRCVHNFVFRVDSRSTRLDSARARARVRIPPRVLQFSRSRRAEESAAPELDPLRRNFVRR
ncbi:PREDICTED: uncharacterized protein LOC108749777 isoform X2 [Trachymyrmex septentrionalis]|uniref:uncharacterized protein LOC108749777 isoform X2 n=1 Tax=Trachymyrmex septentrionalis TaxID=34720 RepID=UPI00084F4B96|nr:PREDICTED: uncharacterized protein LOC108749777 isoform X2 [Trachymyrmex septentrionalis]